MILGPGATGTVFFHKKLLILAQAIERIELFVHGDLARRDRLNLRGKVGDAGDELLGDGGIGLIRRTTKLC